MAQRKKKLSGSFLDGVVPYKTKGTKQLGIFRECSRRCPPGMEKVEVKPKVKRKDGKTWTRGTCICRLDPDNRIKFRGKDYRHNEYNWTKRKPFKKPGGPNIHLRRCKKFEKRRGKEYCVDPGLPIIITRD